MAVIRLRPCKRSEEWFVLLICSGLAMQTVSGSCPALVIDELIEQICLKTRASSAHRTNSSVLRFTKVGHEPLFSTVGF
jgi:hypothetical protein